VQRARCLSVGEGARVLELGVVIDVGEEMVLAMWWGRGRRPRVSTESVSETSVACVVEAARRMAVPVRSVTRRWGSRLRQQAMAAGGQ
jgi:hypothetical protein